MKANVKIRRTARAEGVPLWRVATELGVSEPTMTRWMRTPLSQEKEKAVLDAIKKLAKEAS